MVVNFVFYHKTVKCLGIWNINRLFFSFSSTKRLWKLEEFMAAKRNRKLEKGEMVEKNTKKKKKRIYYYYEGRIIYIIASDKREEKKEEISCGIYFLIEEMGQIIINFCWQKKVSIETTPLNLDLQILFSAMRVSRNL